MVFVRMGLVRENNRDMGFEFMNDIGLVFSASNLHFKSVVDFV